MVPLLGSSTISPAKQATKISWVEVKSLKSSVLNRYRRSQVHFTVKLVFCRARFGIAQPRTQSALSTRAVPPTLLTAEREEAKAVLTLFLKKQGLSTATAARSLNKSDNFIDHLVSKLHCIHKARLLLGQELTTLEIRDALIPYLENLLHEHGSAFVDVVESFPDMPGKEKTADEVVSPTAVLGSNKLSDVTMESRKLRSMARVSGSVPREKLPQHVVYLIDLGMELEKIQKVTEKFPSFANYSLEGKVRPLVEFLLDLGVSKSDIPIIIGFFWSRYSKMCDVTDLGAI